ncbi:uncharacterized protein LOC105447081 [Strongylocentrotus purpuratus]|uniref:Uncharacterized protein n=1 Tax=Strongylocentrotus purpuratus TaxID=7668 RepID=A0A7M7HMW5_STRPU|nr:uncharacterized protein LOC105447081 [Strongylocentrotus purpuratus]
MDTGAIHEAIIITIIIIIIAGLGLEPTTLGIESQVNEPLHHETSTQGKYHPYECPLPCHHLPFHPVGVTTTPFSLHVGHDDRRDVWGSKLPNETHTQFRADT